MPESVLLVIPCLNEAKTIRGLLMQFIPQITNGLIVVADGGSTDGTREIVAEFAKNDPRVRLLSNARRIQSAGINLAVREFGDGCTWLLRVDAHADYPDDYLDRLVCAATKTQADCVVVPMVSRGTAGFQVAAAAAQNSVIGTGGSAHRHVGKGQFVDHGHHALMRLCMFREVGGYREDMPHNEDAELDLRLRSIGARIWLEPGAAIVYYPRSSPVTLWRQYHGYGRGRARTLALHAIRPKLRQVIPLAALAATILLPFAGLTMLATIPFMMWIGACLIGGIMVGLRAGGGAAYFSGVAAAIMHLAWSVGFVSGICSPLPSDHGIGEARA